MAASHTTHPVLLIHGIYNSSALFRKMRAYLERQGRAVHSLDLKPNNGAAGLDALAKQIDHYVNNNFADDQKIDLIGFSMGGLVARYYVQRLGGLRRVRRFMTISSPHHGTRTAFLQWNTGVRQMRPGSAFLRDLNRDAEVLNQVGFISLWTPFDLMILPAHSSVLPAGRAIRVNVAAHLLMVRNSRVLKLIAESLDA